jgi:hypothetical protein
VDADGLAFPDPPVAAAGLLDFATGLADEVARATVAREDEGEGVGVAGGVAAEAGADVGAADEAAGELDGPPTAAADATGALTAGADSTGAAVWLVAVQAAVTSTGASTKQAT